MSMKSTDLEKNRGSKIIGKMDAAGIPSRFGADAGRIADKRERRQLERARGEVPFACKLPIELVKRLQQRAASHEGGINALMGEILSAALATDQPGTAGEG